MRVARVKVELLSCGDLVFDLFVGGRLRATRGHALLESVNHRPAARGEQPPLGFGGVGALQVVDLHVDHHLVGGRVGQRVTDHDGLGVDAELERQGGTEPRLERRRGTRRRAEARLILHGDVAKRGLEFDLGVTRLAEAALGVGNVLAGFGALGEPVADGLGDVELEGGPVLGLAAEHDAIDDRLGELEDAVIFGVGDGLIEQRVVPVFGSERAANTCLDGDLVEPVGLHDVVPALFEGFGGFLEAKTGGGRRGSVCVCVCVCVCVRAGGKPRQNRKTDDRRDGEKHQTTHKQTRTIAPAWLKHVLPKSLT